MLWLGTTDGLEVFDPATGAIAVLRHNAADRYSLSGNEVQSLATDRDGSLWVGTKGGGVNRFSPGSLRFGAWRQQSGRPRQPERRQCPRDLPGPRRRGVDRNLRWRLEPLRPGIGRFTHFRHDPRNPASLDDDRVYSIYEDRSGDLWVGTGMGINRLDRRTGAFTHFKRGPLQPTAWPFPLTRFSRIAAEDSGSAPEKPSLAGPADRRR